MHKNFILIIITFLSVFIYEATIVNCKPLTNSDLDYDVLENEDIEERLRILTPNELKVLCSIIDQQDEENGYDIFNDKENMPSKSLKKKRTMDDFFEELAHENVGDNEHTNGAYKNLKTKDFYCPGDDIANKEKILRPKRENINEESNLQKYIRKLEELSEESSIYDNDQQGKHIRTKRLRHGLN